MMTVPENFAITCPVACDKEASRAVRQTVGECVCARARVCLCQSVAYRLQCVTSTHII